MTPKQEESTRLPSVPTGEPFNTDKDVEVLSTNTANAVSLSGEDLHEGLNPSVAKTAQQISPSVPAGPGGQLPRSVDVSTKGGVMSAGI